ncbi:MAG: glycoside hydrolase family 25 protein [Oscillospiraceae bacterium]|nr:glycoside hydrolase family 25 protein [Oscillospiraceae bacterium]
MLTKIKTYTPNPLFWELLAGGILLLAALTVLIVNLAKPAPAQPESTVTASTEPTGETVSELVENPLKPADFVYREDFLTCLTAPALLGIDVSEWQSQVDWQQVKAAGVEFVIIRAGWRGSELGVLTRDTLAQSHYAGAKAAGLKVGAYFFSQAISVEEAQADADFLLESIRDWELDMPAVFDWEHISDSYRTAQVDARLLTDITKAFCDRITKAGHKPMVYFNEAHSFDRLYLQELAAYDFWLAQYGDKLSYPYRVDMWQYTESGTVPGIEGKVDIDLFFPWTNP